jgi:prepilin-type N-terminal cleavage/methylation domain-containing protein
MERGYSLLEMLVVLAILGLIAVVAIPPIGTSIDHMRLADDARILANALRDAHEQSLNQQRDISFTIGAPNSFQSSAGDRWILSDGSVLAFVAPADAPRSFAFHADGTANAGTFRIVRGKVEADVHVDDITGAVEVAK